jgi:uncharacterized YigZ family protein
LIKDNYHTIAKDHFDEIREKASKFLAFAHRVFDVETVQTKLEFLKSLHPKANHHCYAYQLGIEGDIFRINDDGEPSGTAGKPIYGQIKSHGLTNVLVVVVRYFGGTKLGASGLIQAYKESTALVLSNCEIVEEFISDIFRISFTYDTMGNVMNELKVLNFDIIEKSFESEPFILVKVRRSKSFELLKKLKASLLNISLDRITDETKIEGLTIELVTP